MSQITMTQAQFEQAVAAAVSAALSQVSSVEATPATPKVAANPDVWTNAVGYPCTKEFMAYTSSLAVRKHLDGSCKCRKDGQTCNWEAKGRFPKGTFGTIPGLVVVKDEAHQRFSFADADGNAVEVSL